MHLNYKSMQSVDPTLSFTRLLCSGLLSLITRILQRLLITHTHESQPCLYPLSWRFPWKPLGVCSTEQLLPLWFCHAPGIAPGTLSSALSHGIVSVMNILFDFCLFLSYWHHNSALKARKFRIWFWWFCELTLLTLTLFIPNLCNTRPSFLHF